MFGYVIPVRDEMKVREFEQFRSAYCGLCHTLRRAYGLPARFILNYDFTFLAILLSTGEQAPEYCHRRCVASPFRKKRCCTGGDHYRRAAGYSLILTWWKLRDGVADNGFIRGLPHRLACLLLRPAYRRARGEFDDFDTCCREQLRLLGEFEAGGSDSIDRTADAFAVILRHAAGAAEDPEERRVLEQLLYHTGRWIYLIDACDDLEEDKRSGSYNPLLHRFATEDGALSGEDRDYLRTTLLHSANLIASAYDLLPEGAWSGVLQNIVYLGFPSVTESVLSGKWDRSSLSNGSFFKRVKKRSRERTRV